MKIYFVSFSWLLWFAVLGFGFGALAAYGYGSLPLDHWLAPVTIIAVVIFVSAQVLHVFIFLKSGINFFSLYSKVRTPYKNIRSISLQGRNIAKTKVTLWPSESITYAITVEEKKSTMVLELIQENRKRRVPLRYFSPKSRVEIIHSLIEKVEKYS